MEPDAGMLGRAPAASDQPSNLEPEPCGFTVCAPGLVRESGPPSAIAAVNRILGFEPPANATAEPGAFDFVGWGTAERIDDLELMPTDARAIEQPHKNSLGTWASTALCGNDITSSCLYVAALAAAQAGPLAPVALLMVAVTLYLFRSVYAEVGSALPLNGGTYTLLLNATGKKLAAGAAVLTILSYVTTAVISAGEAMHYAHNLWSGLPILWTTIGLLGAFAGLTLFGITESAVAAVVIFVVHLGAAWLGRSSLALLPACWVSAASRAPPTSSRSRSRESSRRRSGTCGSR